MLIKEYRIPLPLTVEEYRIAQLYMIAKKSREESKGAGSGVEILVNEPYEDGPGGSGQYTHKVYHVGSHLPGWFKSLLPKSALTVEEEAWNAYPYTKTRYTCPFVEKFSLEIETYYFGDNGHQDNVFKLSGGDLRNRIVDIIDVVKDQLYGADYVKEEDPKLYISEKTSRGPLIETWLEDYWNDVKGKKQPTPSGKSLMCAYKLCKVEFRYWGMQSKIEKFIHDVALRKTMLRAHRQAWAWQDEWFGLTMDDIREIERQTQEALKRKMGGGSGGEESDEEGEEGEEESEGQPKEHHHHHHQRQDSTGERATDEEDEARKNQNIAASFNSIEKPDGDSMNSNSGGDVSVGKQPRPGGGNVPIIQTTGGEDDEDSSGRLGGNIRNGSPGADSLSSQDYSMRTSVGERGGKGWTRSNSRAALHSPGSGSLKSFDLQVANWRMESIVRDSDSGSDEEFFDCQAGLVIPVIKELGDSASLNKWSSMELLSEEGVADADNLNDENKQDSIFNHSFLQRMVSERAARPVQGVVLDTSSSLPASPTMSPAHHHYHHHSGSVFPSSDQSQTSSGTTVLLLILHAGSVLDVNVDLTAKKSDVTTFRGAFESVMRQHYPSMVGHISIKLVSCPSICTEGLGVLSSLSPYSFDVSPSCTDTPHVTHDSIPIGAIPIFATSTPEYHEAVSRTINAANAAYQEFLRSEEGRGFSGQICLIGDSVGAILGYDALCRTAQYQSRHDSENSILDGDNHDDGGRLHSADFGHSDFPGGDPLPTPPPSASSHSQYHHIRHLSAPTPRRRSSSTSDTHHCKLEFEVSDFFMFGSPLALVLSYRKISAAEDKTCPVPRPLANQVYNLFHPTDPGCARIEPLLSARFSMLPPVNIARYQKYPLGNGQPHHLLEFVQANPQLFVDSVSGATKAGTHGTTAGPGVHLRRMSEVSIQSTMSGVNDSLPLQTINALSQKWWGPKRLDYALYCPEGLANFPTNALPHLFHASYWESLDVIAFILRQVGRFEGGGPSGNDDREIPSFSPSQPREKWIKKRTSVKLKSRNVAANHRANDVIVRDGAPQVLLARFMYGPLDMITLTGEKVDIYVMKDAPAGEWTLIASEVTDKAGRVSHTISPDKALGYGMYPVKMVVRGDHSSVDFYMAVVPPKTEVVVFSIDGSFTASMSVTGRDPKVRAGAVDIVRHWQELGYLIVYITGRPDMQQQKVVAWLSQHNFPHGLVSFADGLSTDPLGHKAVYLKNLIQEHGVIVHVAYGSSKDIGVYASIGLKPKQIFIVGKVSKKQQALAHPLIDGYAAHLTTLLSHGGSRPAQGNARMVIPRGYFGLPGHNASLRRRR
ncbi:protein retinal degeneration B isoform X2 [Ischnura elegans]|uniref:protein retinal degeneration B isoform X2 n=1 Tax=Ischnura elegans TaxID=197161 RepID=UPI001ED88D4C|nr:protein retinal degeneration B isoform X2 [Ischnura elegans]